MGRSRDVHARPFKHVHRIIHHRQVKFTDGAPGESKVPREGGHLLGSKSLFHGVENMKVVLSTATPMLNDAGEIVSLVNLLRPLNGHPPPDWNWRDTDDATFTFRFPGVAERGLSRQAANWADVCRHFVGQMNPRYDVDDLSNEDLEQHFRGLFAYSRRDPVGVSIVYVGMPGMVTSPAFEASPAETREPCCSITSPCPPFRASLSTGCTREPWTVPTTSSFSSPGTSATLCFHGETSSRDSPGT